MFNLGADTKFVFDDDSNNFNYVQERVCPRCKTSLSEFYRTNMLGCANCYKVFEEEIRQTLLSKQGAMNHVGKVSTKHVSKVKIKEQIEKLEEEKNAAAKDEDFMRAEILKNQIEKLKGELNG